MNNYPIWWETAITVFNKFEDPQTQIVKWFKTIIEDTFWQYTGDKVTVNDVVLETNNIICRIRKDERFLEKYEWIEQPNDEMGNYFTLAPGDIIVKGSVSDEINEYQSGKRSTDILKKYKALQGCMTVEEVANNTGSGRCNEHYFVKGI